MDVALGLFSRRAGTAADTFASLRRSSSRGSYTREVAILRGVPNMRLLLVDRRYPAPTSGTTTSVPQKNKQPRSRRSRPLGQCCFSSEPLAWGGANHTGRPRMCIAAHCCVPGGPRHQKRSLSVPLERSAQSSGHVRHLLDDSIDPPFTIYPPSTGLARGMHPMRHFESLAPESTADEQPKRRRRNRPNSSAHTVL